MQCTQSTDPACLMHRLHHDQCNRNIESVNIHTLNVYTYTCSHTHVCAYMHTTNTHAHTCTKCTHISYMLLLHTHVYTHTHTTHTQSHTYAACSLTLGVYTELVATVTISPFQKVTFKKLIIIVCMTTINYLYTWYNPEILQNYIGLPFSGHSIQRDVYTTWGFFGFTHIITETVYKYR